ncbi:MAG: DNA polymerase IV [Syntrophomonas sp.]
MTNIIHCDLDAFFASVEQLDNPSLIGKPVVVGGDMHSRGVVSTCSYEARKYGVKSAMPTSKAYRLCPQAVFLPVNMPRYVEISRQVFSILAAYSPLMEILSIDEAFLDVSGTEALFGSPEKIGRTIKNRVKSELGLNISVGISYNKFLAKLASDLDKPDGFRIIKAGEALELLKPLPVSRLWGVGEKTAKILESLGLYTIGNIQDLAPGWLEDKIGPGGRRLWELAHGIDEEPVHADYERKSLGRETTFPEDINDTVYLHRLIDLYTAELCSRLRKENKKAGTVQIKLRYGNFKTITRSQSIPPSNSDQAIAKITHQLLDKSYKEKLPLRLFGISLSNLSAVGRLEQGSLFIENGTDYAMIDRLMDEIRARFGPEAINRANLLPDKELFPKR